ncbi:MAG: thiamine phosphate synthase [Mailhella sp.]|nr:thiamine phosphate synthase [Mailhella sp.]
MEWSDFRDFGLYLVTDQDLCLGRPLVDVVLQAVQAGVQAVQIREKNNNTRDFLALAKVLVKEVQVRYNIPVIINDRVDIALASGAAGVHLGQSDMPVADARRLMGTRRIVGLTAPTMETLERAVKEEVQYIAVSPVFPTNTKKDTAPAWGIEGMKKARAFFDEKNCTIPLMTIGGINTQNVKEVLQAGVESVAVVSAICSAQDIDVTVKEFLRAFQK